MANGSSLNLHADSNSTDADEADQVLSFERLKINHKGQVSFHGPTSLLNLPLASSTQSPSAISGYGGNEDTATIHDSPKWSRDQLVTNAWIQKAAETLSNTSVSDVSVSRRQAHFINAITNSDMDVQEPFHDLLQYLLDFHWTWIQPLFNFVYRPAFTRRSLIVPSTFAFLR